MLTLYHMEKYENSIFEIPFLKHFSIWNKPIMCFIYEFDQSDSKLFVQKIWGYRFIIFSKIGPEVQATLSLQN